MIDSALASGLDKCRGRGPFHIHPHTTSHHPAPGSFSLIFSLLLFLDINLFQENISAQHHFIHVSHQQITQPQLGN